MIFVFVGLRPVSNHLIHSQWSRSSALLLGDPLTHGHFIAESDIVRCLISAVDNEASEGRPPSTQHKHLLHSHRQTGMDDPSDYTGPGSDAAAAAHSSGTGQDASQGLELDYEVESTHEQGGDQNNGEYVDVLADVLEGGDADFRSEPVAGLALDATRFAEGSHDSSADAAARDETSPAGQDAHQTAADEADSAAAEATASSSSVDQQQHQHSTRPADPEQNRLSTKVCLSSMYTRCVQIQ